MCLWKLPHFPEGWEEVQLQVIWPGPSNTAGWGGVGWGQNTGLLSVSECAHSPPGISETHTYSVPSTRLNLRNCSGRGGRREQGLSTPCSRAKV